MCAALIGIEALLHAQTRTPPDLPAPRADENSKIAHQQLLEKAAKSGIDVYFVGDSITRRWGATDYPELLANWRAEAARFVAEGDDVYVGGVPAYSTLGYFDDPVLSTYIRYRETELARLMFHELAHQLLYAKDDTVFNESYAVSVEEEGLRRWLASQHDLDLDRQFDTGERYRATFRALVERTRAKLEKLYASDLSDEVKRAGKAEAFEFFTER